MAHGNAPAEVVEAVDGGGGGGGGGEEEAAEEGRWRRRRRGGGGEEAAAEEEAEDGGPARHSLILIVSIRQPGAPMPVSLPSLQRSTTFCPAAEAGRIATHVTKPLFEFRSRPGVRAAGCR